MEVRILFLLEEVKKFIGLDIEVAIEKGAGAHASITDAAYEEAGATVGTLAATTGPLGPWYKRHRR